MRRCNQFLLYWDIPNYGPVGGQYFGGIKESALDFYATQLELCDEIYDCVSKRSTVCIGGHGGRKVLRTSPPSDRHDGNDTLKHTLCQERQRRLKGGR
jgi:hypothetical protein